MVHAGVARRRKDPCRVTDVAIPSGRINQRAGDIIAVN